MKSLSFRVQSQAAGSLTEQVVQGIQSVVNTGRFAVGDRLPTLKAMSAELGVAMNTMRHAIGRLAAEGVLERRRSTGIFVCAAHKPRFRAHVLFVTYSSPASYYAASRNHAFLRILMDHDIHVTTVHLVGTAHNQFQTVRHVLATQPVTLAFLDGEELARENRLCKLLEEHGVRFVEKWFHAPSPRAVDSLFLDNTPAYCQLARYCTQCQIEHVLFFSGNDNSWKSFRDIAQAAGMQVARMPMKRLPWKDTGEVTLERSGYAVIQGLIDRGRIKRDHFLLVSTDDYFTRGAMIAILEAGWRFPDDIQLATMVNAGHMPVSIVPLTRIEVSPVRDGEAMAQLVLRNLTPCKRPRKPLVVHPRFIVGKSMKHPLVQALEKPEPIR